MSATTCPICEDDGADLSHGGADRTRIICPGCGLFNMTGSATRALSAAPFPTGRQMANARGWLSENQGSTINSDDLEKLKEIRAPSVAERAEKLLVALSKRSAGMGAEIEIVNRTCNALWCAASWSEDGDELFYLTHEYLANEKGWLIEGALAENLLRAQISPKGYDYLDSLQRGGQGLDIGFCAMWFAPEVSALWGDAIEPAIIAAGYKAIRIDGVEHNNKIDDEILSNIRRSRFVVADFTGERGGVYFEAGFALGLGRQVIWTVREDALNAVHFDNRQYNFILWSQGNLSEFAKRLRLRIEATVGRGPF